ncbi:MAG: helix-turn-helix domain-containing protein [Actinomycetota bacterium]
MSLVLDAMVAPNLVYLARRPVRPWAGAVLSGVVEQIDVAIHDGLNPLGLPLPASAGARSVAQAIISDPASRCSVGDLAGRFGLSERSLQRHFTNETGLPVSEWQRLLRLRKALGLLAAGTTVEVTARSCGFTSPDALGRLFKSYLGMSPSRFLESTRCESDPKRNWRHLPGTWRQTTDGLTNPSLGSAYQLLEGRHDMKLSTRSLALVVAAMLLGAACGDDSDAEAGEATVQAGDGASSGDETSETPVSGDGNESSQATRTVIDAIGNEVEVPTAPLRVASMDLYTTTRLLELGVHPVVSGVPDPEWELSQEHIDAWAAMGFDGTLLEHETLPYGGEYNIEAIAAVGPDLIVGQPAFIEPVIEQLAGIAPVVQWDSGVLPIAEQIDVVARLVGAEQRAGEITAAFNERLAAIADGIEIESIALVDNNVYDGSFYIYGQGGGITSDWSERLGVDVVAPPNVELDATGGAYISTENVPSLDRAEAVVIFGEPLIGDPLRDNSLFLLLESVESDRLCDAGNFNLAVGLHSLEDYAAQLEEVAGCLRSLNVG